MLWEAANLQRKPRAPELGNVAAAQTNSEDAAERRNRVSTETVEAALSRLSKAYLLSMECIGALNTLNQAVALKDDESMQQSLPLMDRVASSARRSLEEGVLLDPLVMDSTPSLSGVMEDLLHKEDSTSTGDNKRWDFIKLQRSDPPTISSKAHISKIREVAYLALVNYADLLVWCCASGTAGDDMTEAGVLDRGITKPLSSFKSCDHNCWALEAQEDVHQLALAALYDASNLDETDPTVWLKLACAARSLERIRCKNDQSLTMRMRYRRMQRYALEMGSQIISPNLPPNRTVQRALLELNDESLPDTYETKLKVPTERKILTIDLPRYSWSILGRLITKVCRDGNGYLHNHTELGPNHHSPPELFGSPAIALNLPSILAMPSRVMGTICQFLETASIWKFEATCRTLSVSIIPAISSIEKEKPRSVDDLSETQDTAPSQDGKVHQKDTSKTAKDSGDTPTQTQTESANMVVYSKVGDKSSYRSSRSSKRVQSKLITSSKIADRKAKRSSVAHCFLAATLHATKEDHQQRMKGFVYERTYMNVFKMGLTSRGVGESHKHTRGNQLLYTSASHMLEASERISHSSLLAFIQQWNSHSSDPIALLSQFLAHIALHTDDIYKADPSGSLILTSVVVACYDLIISRHDFGDQLIPVFFRPIGSTGSAKKSMELFAIDLLGAELMLRHCDRHPLFILDYDEYANIVSLTVPHLVSTLYQFGASINASKDGEDAFTEREWNVLKIRCKWLAAGFYFWRSRISRDTTESKQAEACGLEFIDEVLDLVKVTNISIRTPHLVSPGRAELHWREISTESLIKFRDDLQASSVVSDAREKIQSALSHLQKGEDTSERITVDLLLQIGGNLFDRYYRPDAKEESKNFELIDEFVSLYGEYLYNEHDEAMSLFQKVKLEDQLPVVGVTLSNASMPNPSVLCILILCLGMDKNNDLKIAKMLSQLIVSVNEELVGLVEERSSNYAAPKNSLSDSDDGSSISEDESGSGAFNNAVGRASNRRLTEYVGFLGLLLDRLAQHISTNLSTEAFNEFAVCTEWSDAFDTTLALICVWQQKAKSARGQSDCIDVALFRSIHRVAILFLQRTPQLSNHGFARSYTKWMIRIYSEARKTLQSLLRGQRDRTKRSALQRVCVDRATFIGMIGTILGDLLSKNLVSVNAGLLTRSPLLGASHEAEPDADSTNQFKSELTSSEFKFFCDCLMWLWNYCCPTGDVLGSTAPTSFDRVVMNELREPIAVTIIGMCGSAVSSRTSKRAAVDPAKEIEVDDPLGLDEFYDSDDSVHDESVDEGETEDPKDASTKTELLRVICHSVETIFNVLNQTDEKDVTSLMTGADLASSKYGPTLPLVAARVLNFYADTLLLHFENTDENQIDLWSQEYPYRTKTIGDLLDLTLHKTYQWTFGFRLIPENGSGSDLGPTTLCNEIAAKKYILEGTKAAAQLYRCIFRAYSSGRRSPPKTALEVVSSVLPPFQESASSSIVKKFLFSDHCGFDDPEKIMEIVHAPSKMEEFLAGISPLLLGSEEHDGAIGADQAEIVRVQKGICAELAKGPLPSAGDSTKTKSDNSPDDERVSTVKFEEETNKKFHMILEDLCQRDLGNSEGWYRAAQCLTLKAELVADRIGLLKGFNRSNNFSVPKSNPSSSLTSLSLPLEALEHAQLEHLKSQKQSWLPFLGFDLRIFTQMKWSSYESLEQCFEQMHEQFAAAASREPAHTIQTRAWQSFSQRLSKRNVVEWQEMWGGVFVSALRTLSSRCFCIALFILNAKQETSETATIMLSEIRESLGVALYTDIMASQKYGYPMCELGAGEKRILAKAAKECFKAAADAVDISDAKEKDDAGDEKSVGRETWDLIFMVGKCNEKIAGTYKRELFATPSISGAAENEGLSDPRRVYEDFMGQALATYAEALKEAMDIEADGGDLHDQAGGSGHGSTEIFYRLHASRLKCLIHAASHKGLILECAEKEALRLVEKYWFDKLNQDADVKESPIRDRVWRVLSDVVGALAKCRTDQHFFHRSVYRHAQALMWAPVLHDPTNAGATGGLETVPVTKSHLVCGLSHSTPVAFSAENIISSLFDKKRSQLCAVWVTAAAHSSSFQVINTSIRKYDSLRGKYISAYLEVLRFCNRKAEVETFLKWVYHTKLDLPAYFYARALSTGPNASKFSSHRSLLLDRRSIIVSNTFLKSIKREANSSFAEILSRETSGTNQAHLQNTFKHAYACFLRLNCSVQDIQKTRAWKYGSGSLKEVDALIQAYCALGGKLSAKSEALDLNDWSGDGHKLGLLKASLDKCKSLFPNLSGSFFSKKASAGANSNKRKKEEEKQVSCEVAVPTDLSEGDTFLTTVKVGPITKRVKLTVPPGKPSTLRFMIKVAADESDEPNSKTARTG